MIAAMSYGGALSKSAKIALAIVHSLYDALHAHSAELRTQGGYEQLDSILNRLRGEVNPCERDFP